MNAPPDLLPEERAVSLVLNGSSVAVLMATPQDLEALLRGFCLSEGIVVSINEIKEIECVLHPNGHEVRGEVSPARAEAITARRRAMVGPVGCGLCGIESLEAASAPPPRLPDGPRFPEAHIRSVLRAFEAAQRLGAASGGMHIAGFFDADGLIAAREDVGRHNALDKLIGALDPAALPAGAALISSRVSIDLVQKCARAGIRSLYALARPTRAAFEAAQLANLTLAQVMREEVFYHTNTPEPAR